MKNIEILKVIEYLANQNRYVNIQELCSHFKISRRTAFYRIKKANQLLESNQIATIKNVRNMGYILNADTLRSMQRVGGVRNLPIFLLVRS